MRSTLTTLGVALGVALFVAIQIINRSTIYSFKESIDSVTGKASLTVSAGETGFPEGKLEVVERVPGVLHAVPMIESRAFLAGGRSHESLNILGVDLLKEQSVRTYKTVGDQMAEEVIDDPLVFLNQPDSIILTRVFSEHHGLKLGSTFEIATADGKKKMTVRGLLTPEGTARAYGGALAIMDIDGAQATFGKQGHLDRIDVVPKEGEDIPRLAERIREAVGSGYSVEKPEGQLSDKERMIRSYQAMLSFFSTLALIVGLFFVTNSVSISVAERRREIGVLRALGTKRSGILTLFLAESLAMGFVGSIVGVGLGRVMAGLLIETVNRSISVQYLTPVKANGILFGWNEVGWGMAAGMGAACIAALWPSFKATWIQPLEAMKKLEISHISKRGGLFGITVWLGIAFMIFLKFSSLFLWSSRSVFLEKTTEILGVVGPALVGPGIVAILILLFRWLALSASSGAGGMITRLAYDNLLQNPKRTGSNVMTLMIGLILVIIIAVMNVSFKKTITVWYDQVLPADLLVSSYGNVTSYQVQPIKEEIGKRIEKTPGVKLGPDRGAYGFRFLHVKYEGKTLALKAWDEPNPEDGYRLFATVDRQPKEAGYELYHSSVPSVIVSENFTEHFGKKTGDDIGIDTPNGKKIFKIVGVAMDYASPEGVFYFDRAVYKKFWNDSLVDGFGLVAASGTTPEELRRRIDSAFGQAGNLMTVSNGEMRESIFSAIDDGFKYTKAIEGAALLVALLSLLNTFLISIMERTRELGVLRALGMSRAQTMWLIMQEALVQGGFGALVAVALGAWIAQLWIVGSLSHTLGWIIHFFFPWAAILTTLGTGVAVTLVAGLYPAWRAAHLEIKEALEYE